MTREIRFEGRMAEADALMWAVEADPVLRSTITCVWVLEKAPDPSRFRAQLERASREIPRLRQRAVADPLRLAPPRWEPDADFDLDFHVRRVTLPAGGSGGDRELLDFARPIAMQAFDKDRPLWELVLVDGLEGGRAAVVMKLHHAVSDGVGLVRMTESLIERSPEPYPRREALPLPPTPEAAEAGAIDRLRDAFGHRLRARREGSVRALAALARSGARFLRSPLAEGRRVAATVASIGRVLSPHTAPLSPIMQDRSRRVRFDAFCVSLAELKRAGKAAGGTVNDAYVAAIAGGLQRYHESRGAPVDELRMLMPVNMRQKDEKGLRAGNQFAPARFLVPTSIADPARRIERIRELVREQRAEPALPLVDEISGLLAGLPPQAVVSLVASMQKATDFTTSNVPGPRFDTYVGGARVERILPFGPLAGAAINATAFSYAGRMWVGVASDPAAVTDPELLIECLRKGLDEVLSVV